MDKRDMAYTPELKQLIRKVEEPRPLRLAKKGEGWEFPRMSLAEKEERLRRFHPSYKDGSLQELKVGSSKGYRLPPEICAILESWSRIDPDRINPAPGRLRNRRPDNRRRGSRDGR
ncbi:MAG: hypothetical protein Q8P64_27840, partial [Deltaproteobacteria bacterium]|nr:hypothetical protein [Deltaproteobacteria bacterium]